MESHRYVLEKVSGRIIEGDRINEGIPRERAEIFGNALPLDLNENCLRACTTERLRTSAEHQTINMKIGESSREINRTWRVLLKLNSLNRRQTWGAR